MAAFGKLMLEILSYYKAGLKAYKAELHKSCYDLPKFRLHFTKMQDLPYFLPQPFNIFFCADLSAISEKFCRSDPLIGGLELRSHPLVPISNCYKMVSGIINFVDLFQVCQVNSDSLELEIITRDTLN